MLLQHSPCAWISPTIFEPELVTAVIVVIDENIAPWNLSFGEPGKCILHGTPAETLASVRLSDRQMIDGTSAAVMTTEYGADDDAC